MRRVGGQEGARDDNETMTPGGDRHQPEGHIRQRGGQRHQIRDSQRRQVKIHRPRAEPRPTEHRQVHGVPEDTEHAEGGRDDAVAGYRGAPVRLELRLSGPLRTGHDDSQRASAVDWPDPELHQQDTGTDTAHARVTGTAACY